MFKRNEGEIEKGKERREVREEERRIFEGQKSKEERKRKNGIRKDRGSLKREGNIEGSRINK